MSRAPAATPSFPAKLTRTFEVACTTIIAWAFGAGSAGLLALMAFRFWSGQIKSGSVLSFAPESFTTGIEQAHPWGLWFSGSGAAFFAAFEAVAVLIGLGMTMMFATQPRRFGLALMVLWSGLWAGDAIVVAAQSWNNGWWHVSMQFGIATFALLVLFAAMLHRAHRLWRVNVSI